MNFLAHLYLSGNNPKIMVGNFLGDFVKGRAMLADFDPEIAQGISLHRGIDIFTDSHPIVKESKARLRSKYRHYAPVIVDMFYDHLLAANWKDYHPDSLQEFSALVYRNLSIYQPVFPEKAKQVLPYIIRGNWLMSYATIEGIHRALSGMAQRSKHDSKMDEASEDLKANYAAFTDEFTRFFPELVRWKDHHFPAEPLAV